MGIVSDTHLFFNSKFKMQNAKLTIIINRHSEGAMRPWESSSFQLKTIMKIATACTKPRNDMR